jgi:diguanylate cyclase
MGVTIATLLLVLICTCGFTLHLLRRGRQLQAKLDEVRGSSRIDHPLLLRSRQSFGEDLQLELSRVDRTGRPACLVVLSLGEEQGDQQADGRRAIGAQVLRSTIRMIDLGYRIGAEEYALILPETRARGGLVAAGRIEEKLLAAGVVGITAGVAEAGPGIDRHQLFRHAYCALLSAGRGGHSTVLAYSPELEQSGAWGAEVEGLSEIEPA